MDISFKKLKSKTRLINPMKGFSLDEIPLEIRFDPLTGQTGRVFDLPYVPPAKPDLSGMIRRSKEIFCPFCPEALEKSTPLFPKDFIPDGRIQVGQASLIPNLLPLDKYAGVSILSHEHYVAIEGLTPERMKDAFSAVQVFIRRVMDYDTLVKFFYINWNYMPPAGSSLLHPHIQVNCGEFPTNQHRIQLEASRRYRKRSGNSFWHDFMEAEKARKERYIGEIDSTFWAMSYVPQSFLPDVWCIFTTPCNLPNMELEAYMPFLKGLSRVLKYFSLENIYSFNISIFAVKEDADFQVNARICPRLLPRPIGNSDQTYFQIIHREPCCIKPPESVCQEIRKVFRE
jgi:UDPglucose--hexose-1-phosphate uridylyltransferase